MTRDEIEYIVNQKIHNQHEPLAEEFDLSVRQVKNIVYKCEDLLFCK